MAWSVTHSLDDFEAAAGAYLRADPVVNTVPLTVLAALRATGPAAYGDQQPVFGWHLSAAGQADGAFLRRRRSRCWWPGCRTARPRTWCG
jgi:hypothetical protein